MASDTAANLELAPPRPAPPRPEGSDGNTVLSATDGDAQAVGDSETDTARQI
ncbi:MAG: hypothetical protein ACLGHT_06305 [Acidimicrobiia bacterium]